MRALALTLAVLGQGAGAAPLFEDRSAQVADHVYAGGWEHFVGGGVAIFDCNDDGLPEMFAAGGANPASLFINQGGFSFERREMETLTAVTGAYPLNVDGDGHMDLFVLRAGPNLLLRGQGGCAFEDVSAAWGLPTDNQWSTAFTAWWEEGAAHPTLAIGNYVDREDPDGPFEACDTNLILHPSNSGYVPEVLAPGFCPLSMLAAKDARDQLTLRISNDRHYYVKGGFEQMWDIAESRFLTEADGWPQVSLWGMGIASRDLNGDDRDEVMLTSMGDQVLQLAQADGSYVAAPYDIGTYAQRPHTGGDGRPSTGWHAEFGDIDNDGRADLFMTKGNVDQMPGMATRDPNNLLMQLPSGQFKESAAEAGIATMARSRGGGLADFDGDGRLDIVVVNRRAGMELYRNVTPDVGNWIGITLRQAGANPDAVGARIHVLGPGAAQSAQVVVGGGHAGGKMVPQHFGLGTSTKAQVQVTWPDGVQSEHDLISGQNHIITKN